MCVGTISIHFHTWGTKVANYLFCAPKGWGAIILRSISCGWRWFHIGGIQGYFSPVVFMESIFFEYGNLKKIQRSMQWQLAYLTFDNRPCWLKRFHWLSPNINMSGHGRKAIIFFSLSREISFFQKWYTSWHIALEYKLDWAVVHSLITFVVVSEAVVLWCLFIFMFRVLAPCPGCLLR